MQQCARSFLLLALLLSWGFQELHAQQNEFKILRVDDSNWPTMRAEYILTDVEGNSIRDVATDEFTILEDGQAVTITSRVCPPDPAPTPLDVVLVNDRSSSMWDTFNNSDELRIQLLKRGAQAFINRMEPSLSNGSGQVAMTGFAIETILLQDFTSDALALRTAINNLDPIAIGTRGTSYTSAFGDSFNGAIELLKNRPVNRGNPPQEVQRYIVLLTDGACVDDSRDPCFEPWPYGDSIRTHDINLISIAMGFTMGDSLRSLTESVDGTIYEQITEQDEIEAMYAQIAETIQGRLPCSITWESRVGCEDVTRDVLVTYTPDGKTENFKYRPDPAKAVATYEVTPTVLSFGNPEPNSPVTRTFKLTIGENPLGRYTISNILISDPPLVNNNIVITGISVNGGETESLQDFLDRGGELAPGTEVVITVTFTQDDERNFIVRNLIFESEPCDIDQITMWGGGARTGTPIVQVEANPVNSRCKVMTIRWFTTPLERRMRLLYKAAGATEWIEITNDATGGTYDWTIPPELAPGVPYELRAEANGEFADWDWVLDEGAAAKDEVNAVTTNGEGGVFAVGSFVGEVEFGVDPDTDLPAESVGHFVAAYEADGTLIRAAASRANVQGTGVRSLDAVDVAATAQGIYVIGNNIGDTRNVRPDGVDEDQTIRFLPNGNLGNPNNAAVRGPHANPDLDFLGGPFIDVDVRVGGSNAFVLGNMTFSNNRGVKLPGFYVEKYDQDLNALWRVERDVSASTGVDVPGAQASAMGVGVDESVVVVGLVTEASTAFGPVTLPRGPFVAKYDRNADFVWAIPLQAGENVLPADVAVNRDGDIFVVGTYDGNPVFGGRTLNSIGFTDVFVTRLSGDNGAIQWAARAYSQRNSSENDDAIGVDVDLNGDCYITGAFRGREMFLEDANGTVAFELSNYAGVNSGSAQVFVARYALDGSVVWANGGGGDRDDIPAGISVDEGGGIALTGNFAIDVVGAGVGRPTFGSTVLEHRNGGDMFIAKLLSYQSNSNEFQSFEIAAPVPDLLPAAPVDFGEVPIGRSVQQFPQLINAGNWPMKIDSWTIGGVNPGDFEVANIPESTDDEVDPFDPADPKDVVGLEITFTPGAQEPRSALLLVTADCGDEKSFLLQGVGVNPCTERATTKVPQDPAATTDVGNTAQLTITDAICNQTDEDFPLRITLTGIDDRYFEITSPNPTTLAANTCYTLEIDFSPLFGGPTEIVQIVYELGSCAYEQPLRAVGAIEDASILADEFQIGPIICADDQPVTQTLTITNVGSSELILDDPQIPVGDHGFSVDPSETFPINVPGGESVEITIIFDPAELGPKSTTITFGGNAANASDPIPLNGAKEDITWSFSPNPVDFGNLSEVEFDGISNVIDLVITNTGSIPADLNGATVAPPFEIVGNIPLGTNLAPGESLTVQVRFVRPDDEGANSAELTLVYEPECDPAMVTVSGSRGEATVDLDIPNLDGDVRDREFRIPITMTPEDSYALLSANAAARAFEMTFRVDARLLLANDNDLAASDCINCTSVTSLVPGVPPETVQEWRHITVTGTAPAWSEGEGAVNLLTIGGIVMLGNAESTPIELVSYTWPGVSVNNQEAGSLTLAGVCEEGGVRLLQRAANGFGIKSVSPNPANGQVQLDVATVEVGLHILEVYDVSGNVVYSRQWQEPARYNEAGHMYSGSELQAVIDAGELPSGIYQVVLRTPTDLAHASMVISH